MHITPPASTVAPPPPPFPPALPATLTLQLHSPPFPFLAVPMVESWPFSISYREGNAHHTCSLHSDARLNLLVTPASFRSLGDLYCFSKMVTSLPDAARRSMPTGMARGLTKSREKMPTLYRCAYLHNPPPPPPSSPTTTRHPYPPPTTTTDVCLGEIMYMGGVLLLHRCPQNTSVGSLLTSLRCWMCVRTSGHFSSHDYFMESVETCQLVTFM